MTLFHRDLGGAGAPPLVILHGLLGSSRNWQTAGRDLARSANSPAEGATAGFHVFALDLRNHGASPHAREMTYAAMAEDVIAWLDAQGMVVKKGKSLSIPSVGRIRALIESSWES